MFRYYFIFFSAIIWSLEYTAATIWVKNVKFYGPSATVAGTNCLASLSDIFFRSSSVARPKNIIMGYPTGLTTPADNIQRSYLLWLHKSILRGQVTELVFFFFFSFLFHYKFLNFQIENKSIDLMYV